MFFADIHDVGPGILGPLFFVFENPLPVMVGGFLLLALFSQVLDFHSDGKARRLAEAEATSTKDSAAIREFSPGLKEQENASGEHFPDAGPIR